MRTQKSIFFLAFAQWRGRKESPERMGRTGIGPHIEIDVTPRRCHADCC